MQQLNRAMIKSGVYLNQITDDRFKKQRITAAIIQPITRGDITTTALLPYLMERSSAECPSPVALQRRLSMLYGASYSCSCGKSLGRRYLSFSFEGLRKKFIPDRTAEKEYCDFILSCIFKPDFENGLFKAEATEIEKEKHRQLIASQYNDKRFFCLKSAVSSFYSGDFRGLDNAGFAEDLEGIGPAALTECYNRYIGDGEIEIFAVNTGDILPLLEAVPDRSVHDFSRPPAIPYCDEVRQIYIDDSVNQDNITMLFTGGRLLDRRERAALRIASAALGGTDTSRLFMNVREKQSLCYFCSSSPDLMNSSLAIVTGVAHSDADRAKQAILQEFSGLCGGITKRELAQTKLALKNAYLSVGESVGTVCNWYMGQIISGIEPFTPEDELELMNSITADEVVSVLNLFKLHTVCQLGKAKHDNK